MHKASSQTAALPADTKQLVVVGLLGFASGLPLALTGSTLQAWLTTAGLDLKTIGAMSLVGLPYLYKFVWAPLLDRTAPLPYGRRRAWLVLTQLLLAALLLVMSYLQPARELSWLLWAAALLAFISATQDIAVDAYRAEILTPTRRGLGAGCATTGYRVAMIISGAGALIAADYVGFGPTLRLLAALMALLALMSLLAAEPMVEASPARSLWIDLSVSLKALFARPGVWSFVACVFLYKLGDAFAGSLSLTFFIRGQGFSLTEIGSAYKALGTVAAIAGGLVGGWWMMRLSLYRALFIFGVLQLATNLGFYWLAVSGKSLLGMCAVVVLENLAGGMGASALVALLIALSERRFTATHFALWSALASTPRVLIGPFAAPLAEQQGWAVFFAGSVLLGLPALVAVWATRRNLSAL